MCILFGVKTFRHLCSAKKEEEGGGMGMELKNDTESKLEVQFFSFTTVFYLVSTYARFISRILNHVWMACEQFDRNILKRE